MGMMVCLVSSELQRKINTLERSNIDYQSQLSELHDQLSLSQAQLSKLTHSLKQKLDENERLATQVERHEQKVQLKMMMAQSEALANQIKYVMCVGVVRCWWCWWCWCGVWWWLGWCCYLYYDVGLVTPVCLYLPLFGDSILKC